MRLVQILLFFRALCQSINLTYSLPIVLELKNLNCYKLWFWTPGLSGSSDLEGKGNRLLLRPLRHLLFRAAGGYPRLGVRVEGENWIMGFRKQKHFLFSVKISVFRCSSSSGRSTWSGGAVQPPPWYRACGGATPHMRDTPGTCCPHSFSLYSQLIIRK